VAENGFELLGTMVGAKPARVAFLRGQVAKQREKIKALHLSITKRLFYSSGNASRRTFGICSEVCERTI